MAGLPSCLGWQTYLEMDALEMDALRLMPMHERRRVLVKLNPQKTQPQVFGRTRTPGTDDAQKAGMR
jgi:hypothetical protein